jgi:hypothetical protein
MALAKHTVVFCLLPTLSGCLVQEPPDLEDPERTRPFIIVGLVVPTLSEYHRREIPMDANGVAFEATIPIQSEDLGENIALAVHQDIGTDSYRWLGSRGDIAPATMADGPWDITLPPVRLEDFGCHYITAIFAHQSSFNTNPQDQFVQEDLEYSDSSSITWTVNVHGVNSTVDPTVLTDCPRSETAATN